jgi:hypothetical protein
MIAAGCACVAINVAKRSYPSPSKSPCTTKSTRKIRRPGSDPEALIASLHNPLFKLKNLFHIMPVPAHPAGGKGRLEFIKNHSEFVSLRVKY